MPARLTAEQIEQRTQRLGREMFERIRGAQPSVVRREWWQERLLEQCMADEWFKVQAFRFVDALPMLGDDVELARHLKEYFVLPEHRAGDNGHHDPHASNQAALRELDGAGPRWFVRWVSYWMNFKRLDSLWARIAAQSARRSALLMAGSFIAGSTVEQAERVIRRMRKQQMAFTIDVLGEAAMSRQEAEAYQETYLDLIRNLPKHAAQWSRVPLVDEADGEQIPRVNVSVKLTSLHPGFDPIAPGPAKARAKEVLRPLFRLGMEGGVHVHVDMEHYAIKDLTLEVFEELLLEDEFRDYPDLGIVLQAYLRDGDRDAARMIELAKRRGTPFWVRLVKGAYWDSETVWADQAGWPWPVWEQKWMSDACYERMTHALLANHEHLCTAFASHNIRSLAHAMALREMWEIPGTAFELQMLYGMGDPIKRAAIELGQRCRIYTPYGPLLAGMAYFIRRLLENTANESFLRQAADVPEDDLLRNPDTIGAATPPFERPLVVRYEFEEPLMDAFTNVPNSDFSQEQSRQQMLAGLAQVRADLGRRIPLLINGQRVETETWADSLNPSRPAEVVARVAQADGPVVEQAVQSAVEAGKAWRRVPPHERADYLFKVVELMQGKRAELAALAAIECGKPWREADGDVSEAIDYCNYYAREITRVAENIRERDVPGETNLYFYSPRGVVGVISPWNFPLAIPAGMIAAAVVTGNAVVFKPASPAAAVGAALADLFAEAGVPAGVVNYVPGPGPIVGEALVRHPDVATIAFTGSREVGLHLNALAAQTATARPGLKRVIAQMGAKNAIIVDSDADLDAALGAVVQGAFGYAGQKCTACARVIVIEPAHDRFVERLVEKVRTSSVGPAEEPTTSIPPLIDQAALDRVREYVALGKKEARCVLEVDAKPQVDEFGGYYLGPVIFDDVPPAARIAREEIFGPVLSIVRARDIDEAIAVFNDTDYALAGGIYSRSPANIDKARRECECGNFYINRPITGSHVDLQPFGGLKMSGTGATAGGPDYLIQFCEPRTITENTIRRGFAPSEEVLETLGQ
ncbi:MAG: proline dehydrogenase family protein [Phycisphaerae bacterium]|jgi:RHH-type proline utilization regulon transcriptional repressor/proline dehydrogenase/delta 1-pyrroline-5-carboxylate dehydrogenase